MAQTSGPTRGQSLLCVRSSSPARIPSGFLTPSGPVQTPRTSWTRRRPRSAALGVHLGLDPGRSPARPGAAANAEPSAEPGAEQMGAGGGRGGEGDTKGIKGERSLNCGKGEKKGAEIGKVEVKKIELLL